MFILSNYKFCAIDTKLDRLVRYIVYKTHIHYASYVYELINKRGNCYKITYCSSMYLNTKGRAKRREFGRKYSSHCLGQHIPSPKQCYFTSIIFLDKLAVQL